MAISNSEYDYRALWDRQRKRTMKLIRRGEEQRDELEELRRQRDMLARRLAEASRELVALKYPKQQAA